MKSSNHMTYQRPDGAIGVGYLIPWAGRFVHSVAWPDLPSERYSVERMERMGVKVLGLEEARGESDDAGQETPAETIHQAIDPAVVTSVDVVPIDASSGVVAEAEATIVGPSGDSSAVVGEQTAEDEAAGADAATSQASAEAEAAEVSDAIAEAEEAPVSEAQAIRDYLQTNPEASNKEVIAALKERGVEVSSGQVTRERKRG